MVCLSSILAWHVWATQTLLDDWRWSFSSRGGRMIAVCSCLAVFEGNVGSKVFPYGIALLDTKMLVPTFVLPWLSSLRRSPFFSGHVVRCGCCLCTFLPCCLYFCFLFFCLPFFETSACNIFIPIVSFSSGWLFFSACGERWELTGADQKHVWQYVETRLE